MMLQNKELNLSGAFASARSILLSARSADGLWRGELSGSALSTAVAAFALDRVDRPAHATAVARAMGWLAGHANPDGGWGDTPESPSNLSTTLLAWAALGASGMNMAGAVDAQRKAAAWIAQKAGGLEPEILARAVLSAYGNDRTFSAPILAFCAMAGSLGKNPWQFVPQLPFELSALPHGLFRFARLDVVSYALPALIAIGLARHRRASRSLSPLTFLRDAAVSPALGKLQRCQPENGGFLEAAPLNGFVASALVEAGLQDHPVARSCASFLASTVRPDGSWPIDTNLALWLTALAVDALAEGGRLEEALPEPERAKLLERLVSCQFKDVHPYTHSAPGGWGWNDLPGAVPDADDTSGILMALHHLGADVPHAKPAAAKGIMWLLGLQNSDGGLPTFCRGWGRLPFDRNCPDITAHALLAFDRWHGRMAPGLRRRMERALESGLNNLASAQGVDGSWRPLWFGNQLAPEQANPVYGTAHVVRALARLGPGRIKGRDAMARRGTDWLLGAQNADGGWGGAAGVASSIEETALALSALDPAAQGAPFRRGIKWLLERTAGGTRFDPAPIGLYFSRLWYSERLYPVIFSCRALAGVHATHGEGKKLS